MADNIKEFSLTWVLFAVLMVSLLTFALIFSFNNNPDSLGVNEDQVRILEANFSDSLIELEDDMDSKLNSSAKLNSEDTELGTASASATSYEFMGTGQSKVTLLKKMILWMFAGDFGKLIAKVISGIFGLVGLYYLVVFIRRIL